MPSSIERSKPACRSRAASRYPYDHRIALNPRVQQHTLGQLCSFVNRAHGGWHRGGEVLGQLTMSNDNDSTPNKGGPRTPCRGSRKSVTKECVLGGRSLTATPPRVDSPGRTLPPPKRSRQADARRKRRCRHVSNDQSQHVGLKQHHDTRTITA